MSFIDDAMHAISDGFEAVKDFFADLFSESDQAEADDSEVVETLRIEFDAENPLPAVGILK